MFANRSIRAARPIANKLNRPTSRPISTSTFSPTSHPIIWTFGTVLGGLLTYELAVRQPALVARLPKDWKETMAWRQAQEEKALGGSVSLMQGGTEDWEEVRRKETERRAKGVAEKKAFTGGDQGFVDLVLEKAEDVSHNSKVLRFKLPEDSMVSGLEIASAILTKFQGPDDAKPTLRPYTPISPESAQGYVDLLVKAYPNGPMSTHIHSLKPGDKLAFKGPLPKYPWTTNKHPQVALIAGGTGITPMYQLIRTIFSDERDTTSVTVVFGNVSEPDILLKKELEQLENTFPRRMRVFYALNNPPKSWTGGKAGHVDKELLQTVLPGPDTEGVKVFVCGPPGMYKAISGAKKSPKDQGEIGGILKELGYTETQVYKF
ncbi:MAG: NADH-cytochrome b5 reductase [Vezdaea aestivalis]|nr:MAG: NADH-cytochrome b5 reductase [Vezdaea aestivalis]